MKQGQARRRGFTLIDMLVVIAIIAILAAASLPMVSGLNDQSRITTCQARLTEIGVAIRLYFEDHRRMPASLRELLAAGYLEQSETLRCCRTGSEFWYRALPAEGAPADLSAACVAPDTPPGSRPHRHHELLVELHRHGGVSLRQ